MYLLWSPWSMEWISMDGMFYVNVLDEMDFVDELDPMNILLNVH